MIPEHNSKKLSKEKNSELEPIERVQLARHEKRPYALDYISRIFTDFRELHGDRSFRDDAAIIGGFAKLDGRPVLSSTVGSEAWNSRDLKSRPH